MNDPRPTVISARPPLMASTVEKRWKTRIGSSLESTVTDVPRNVPDEILRRLPANGGPAVRCLAQVRVATTHRVSQAAPSAKAASTSLR